MKAYFVVLSLFFFLCFTNSCKNEEVKDVMIERMKNGELADSVGNYQEYINSKYQVFAMPLPEVLDFAGEQVPLDNVFVRDNLDREILVNTYWHSNTFLYQKRANRWFPALEKILKKHNMPDDLKYLALVESGLDNVVSPAGAAGFWQFMPATARGRGLEISQYVDERYDLEKSTVAAIEYLKAAHKQFGSWSLAAASYNMGKGGLNNQLTKQKVDTYYDLYLNKETSRYVYRILAAKLILSNSDNFGFNTRSKELYQPYNTYSVSIDSSISSLPQFANDMGTNYATLRHLNPWIRGYELPNFNNKTYTIKMPRGDFHVESEPEIITESDTIDEEDMEVIMKEDSIIKKKDSLAPILSDSVRKLVKVKSKENLKNIQQ